MRLAFFASYNGSSAKAITQACKDQRLNAEAVLLISNNENAGAFGWAQEQGLETACIKGENTDTEHLDLLQNHAIDFIILSGYMKLLGPQTIQAFQNKILNIHPALLPKYGGKGMYGRHVHDAVIKAQEKETGITIHLVDEIYDNGKILAQRTIPVLDTDTSETLENRVRAAEPEFYVETLQQILDGTLSLT